MVAADRLHISILTLDPTSRLRASWLAENLIGSVRDEYINTVYSSLPAEALALAGVTPSKKLFEALNVGSMSEYLALQKSFIVHEHSIPIRGDYPMPRCAVKSQCDDELKRLALKVDSFVDVRDHSGKWIPAQVKSVASLESRGAESTERRDLLLHFIGWSDQWNDVIASRTEPHRFAEFHRFSAPSVQTHRYDLNEWVDIYAHKSVPPKWRRGKITRLNASQCEVTFLVLDSVMNSPDLRGSFHRFWFPFRSDEMYPLPLPQNPTLVPRPRSRFPVERRNAAKFTDSEEYQALRVEHPEVHAVMDAIASEYLALRERAYWIMCKAFLCPEVELGTIRTNVFSTGVLFALRYWLMQYETINAADAETLVRTEMEMQPDISNVIIKKMVEDVLETAAALKKVIQNAPVARQSFAFILMPGKRIVLMESGFFSAAWRRCVGCAKAGVRRCGLVWYCSKECKENVPHSVKSAAHDMKSASLAPLPAFDRSVFRAAQMVLAEGFRPIKRMSDFNEDDAPDESSCREVRRALYGAVILTLPKKPAPARNSK